MQPTLTDTSFLIRESAEAYHAQATDHLSSHALADFRRCPQLFHQKRTGIIVDEDRPAYVVGRAVHTLALEGQALVWRGERGPPTIASTGPPIGARRAGSSRSAS